MLAAGKLSHQKYIIVFQDCVLKVCEPFHYVSSVKVSKPTAFLLHYSDKASFPLRCFNDLTDFGAYGVFEDNGCVSVTNQMQPYEFAETVSIIRLLVIDVHVREVRFVRKVNTRR